MLGFIVIVAALIFAVIVPLLVLIKYYKPSQYNLLQNIFWIAVTIITWPLMPIVLAVRNKDKITLSVFYTSFLVMAVGAWYWCVLNVHTVIAIQQFLLQRI